MGNSKGTAAGWRFGGSGPQEAFSADAADAQHRTASDEEPPQLAAGFFTVGALVVANFGQRPLLRMDGLPVGRHLADWKGESTVSKKDGSIMMVVATDAPLTSRQLLRVAKRAGLGLARTGTGGSHGSGDFVIAFSTANRSPLVTRGLTRKIEVLAELGEALNPLFLATVEAVEEGDSF